MIYPITLRYLYAGGSNDKVINAPPVHWPEPGALVSPANGVSAVVQKLKWGPSYKINEPCILAVFCERIDDIDA